MPDQNWNPYFRALWKHCSAKPDAQEDHPWGESVFKIGGKIFAFLGTPDHGGVGVKVAPEQIEGLLRLSFIERSPYIGRYGWLAVTIADADALELARELVDASYEMIAVKSKGKRETGRGATATKKSPSKKQSKRRSTKKPQ
jgi:predicted DNA-binding protein (MmcQ/YjbR family)